MKMQKRASRSHLMKQRKESVNSNTELLKLSSQKTKEKQNEKVRNAYMNYRIPVGETIYVL